MKIDLFETLTNAVKENDRETVQELIDSGVDINLKDEDDVTVIMYADRYGYLETVRALIEAGALVDLQDKNGWTALMHAVETDYIEVVRALINAGADINLQDNDNKTALIHAAENDSVAKIRTLKEVGALLNLQNKDGKTALMFATQRGHTLTVSALIEAGALLNLQDKDGVTCLMLAAKNGDMATFEVLINAGADLKIKDNKGASAFVYASLNEKVLEFLLEQLPASKRVDKAIDTLKVALRQAKHKSNLDSLVAYITKHHTGMHKDWDRFMLAAYLGDEDLLITPDKFSEKEIKKILTKQDSNKDNYILIAAKAGNLEFVENMLVHEFTVHSKINKQLLLNTLAKLSSLPTKVAGLAELLKELQELLDVETEASVKDSSVATATYTPAATRAITALGAEGAAGGAGLAIEGDAAEKSNSKLKR